MSPSDAKALLQKENELLGKLITTVNQFQMTAEQSAVLNDWTVYFTRWQTVNDELRGLGDDQAFKARLKAEAKVLNDLKDYLRDDNSTHGKFYKEMFDKDATKADQMAGT